jgi:hypothetical protein
MAKEAPGETMVRIVDVLFRHFAEQVSPQTGFSIEKATAGLWILFERGDLVTGAKGGLAVETGGENRAERRAQAKKNRPLIEFRHRMARGLGDAVR